MGIEVSAHGHVSINDQHENGVDTSVDGNPRIGRFKGITTFNVFNRNFRGPRRDDGNPLMHALKGRRGYQITNHWESQFNRRMTQIVDKCCGDLSNYDYILPTPSSSPFCVNFANSVSVQASVPVLASSFLRKKTVGELLSECRATPPKMRPGQRNAYTSQLAVWETLDPNELFEAKLVVENGIRTLFDGFSTTGIIPNVHGKSILVVDDLFATGSSLLSIRGILEAQGVAKVGYLSYLSGG